MLANEGQPALVEASVEQLNQAKGGAGEEHEEFDNKGVFIIRDEEAEALKAMREEIKRRFQLATAAKNDDEEEEDEEEEVEEADQEAGADEEMDDEKFQERLEREYADDQIGDAEDQVELDENGLLTKEALDDAVNEFIESQKLRDRNLYRHFREGDQPFEIVPMIRKIVPEELQEDPAILEKIRMDNISKYPTPF